MKKSILSLAALAAFIALPVSGNAHVIIEGFEGRVNYNEVLTLIVPHGCGTKPTTQIRMKIPPAVPLFAPEEKDGWNTELVMRELDEPITRPNGQVIREVYDEVIWTGDLPATHMGCSSFLPVSPAKPDPSCLSNSSKSAANSKTAGSKWSTTASLAGRCGRWNGQRRLSRS